MANPVELLGDLFAVAEKKLGVPAERLMKTVPLSELESMLDGLAGSEIPPPVEEAAICGAWIIRHQPFPRYNREIGYAYMRLLLRQAGVPWPRPQEDAHQIENKLQALEDGLISEAKFVDWVRLRVATA
jgi:hypothetical protein